MLNPMYDHHVGYLVNAVNDPVVPSTSGEHSNEVSDERLAESVRVLADRAPNCDEHRIAYFCWKLVEGPSTLGGDPDLVSHPKRTSTGRQREEFASRSLGSRPG